MHLSILSSTQTDLFPLLQAARRRGFYMVGGTAISLHIGHRESIDFDLFRAKNFRGNIVQSILDSSKTNWDTLYINEEGQYTGIIQGVKTTFFYYPFTVSATVDLEGVIKIPDLLTLGAMKAYAMGRRAKWKDYVDLFFILKYHYTLGEICETATSLFPTFQSAQFIEQLAYHDDINYSESVEYLIPNPPSDEEIKQFLIDTALTD